MNKAQAKYIFRGTKGMMDALGLSRQAIYLWPSELNQKQIDHVTGACLRLKLRVEYPRGLK